MTDFDETDHPRATAGKFTDKPQTAPEASLTPKPARKPGELGGFTVKGYKEHSAGMEGGGFTASIYRDGKRVIAVSNDGNGGSNLYRALKPAEDGAAPETQLFREFAARALPDAGPEPEGSILETMKWLRDIEMNIAQQGWPRDEAIEANIKASDDAAQYDYLLLSDREKEILRDPTILDAID